MRCGRFLQKCARFYDLNKFIFNVKIFHRLSISDSSSTPRMHTYKRTSSPRSPTNSSELYTPAHEENVRFIHDSELLFFYVHAFNLRHLLHFLKTRTQAGRKDIQIHRLTTTKSSKTSLITEIFINVPYTLFQRGCVF